MSRLGIHPIFQCPVTTPLSLAAHLADCLCSVARDRAWFKDDYVPYQTRFTNSQGEELEAIGIGTVVLSTRSPVGNERTEITLRNVLHSPDIVSNIVGYPVYEDYYIDPIQVPYSFWRLRNSKGTPVAHFTQEGNKARLGFCKPPPGTESGPNVLPSDKVPAVYWPETERDRFATTQGDSPYGMSDSERAWLKEHWGDEFRFLLNHKLNMYDEGERRQGRKIMMTDMADESRGRDSQSTLRNVPEALRDRYNTLLAVLNFSDTEVEWIEVRYGDLKTFLDWFRFKLYEPDELKGAKQHLRWLMEKEAVLRKLAKDHRMI